MRKLKNPLKYIQRLKAELLRSRSLNDHLRTQWINAVGRYWFKFGLGWTTKITRKISLSENIEIGTSVIIRGRITEIHQTESDENYVTITFEEARLTKKKETFSEPC